MPTIDVRGAAVAYTDTGAPPGVTAAPAVVFGHGLLFGGWMFRAQIAALKDSYRCVAIDWRGQGESPATRDGYDMDSLTADAVALITQIGIGPVHWVGHSMGGFVGQRLAARHGELLRSLTLLDTSAEAEHPAKVREQELLALFQLFFGVRPILGKVKPLLFGPGFLADPASAELVGEWLGRLSKTRRVGIRRALHGAACRAAVTDEIGRITLPVLVVVGADDQATPPEHAQRIASSIGSARLAIVPGCGHSSTLEQPDAISALLAEFLRDVDQTGNGTHPAPARQSQADASYGT
jgi:pimeloyl-ACP methyl ester carboxylesterase